MDFVRKGNAVRSKAYLRHNTSSSEDYNIKTPDTQQNAKKRSAMGNNNHTYPVIHKKGKITFVNEAVDPLQETLDNVNLTCILKSALPEDSPSNEKHNKTEFDVFANYLNITKDVTQNKTENKLSLNKTEGEAEPAKNKYAECFGRSSKLSTKNQVNNEHEFSQTFNTQIMNQIDTIIEDSTKNDESDNRTNTNEQNKSTDVFKAPLIKSLIKKSKSLKAKHEFSQTLNSQIINQIDTIMEEGTKNHESLNRTNTNTQNKPTDNFKTPLIKSLIEKSNSLKEKHQTSKISDKTLLFNDESVTTQYKNEVNKLFEQIEQSICAMGTEDVEKTIPDNILDVIFADDIASSTNIGDEKENEQKQAELGKTLDNINWSQDLDSSFGTIIKQALINNASKQMQIHKVDNNVLDLSLTEKKVEFQNLGPFYGLPVKVKELIKQYKGIEKLYDWQDECIKKATEKRKNLIYALPTSGGKTLVAEILMLRELLCYQSNAICILPYVAIVQEKVWDFSPFGVALDFLVEEYASSKGAYPPRKRRRKHSVYVCTIEKALGLINSLIETGRLHEIGLIVIDELHLIGEEGRGATLEASLTKVQYLNAKIQIIGMSATIGNIKDISRFLKADVYTKDFRPVELIEYVKCGSEIAKINWNYTHENDLLVCPKKVDYKYSEQVAKIDPDMIGGLALEVIPKGSCLIFCASKKNCENVTYLLCKLAKPDLRNHKHAEKQLLLEALKGESGELCEILGVSVPFGIAYHHSGLTNDERRLIEDGFRAGTLSVICCTSTLAAGVNLPARRVILRSPYVGRQFITLSMYKQMAGRAGRAGFEETGESIIVTQPMDLSKVKDLLMSPMNQAHSSMHGEEGKGLRHLLLSCISLGIANTRSQLQAVARTTLMGIQADKLDLNVKSLTDNVIKNLFKLGAIEQAQARGNKVPQLLNVTVKMDTTLSSYPSSESSEDPQTAKKTVILTNNSKLLVSNLGVAAIKGGLELSRAHQLYDDLTQAQKSLVLIDCLHLLYLVTPYETAEQVRPNMQTYYELLSNLGTNETQTARILGFNECVIVKMVSGLPVKQIPETILKRFYVTLMLYDLWNEMPVFKVSEKFQIDRGLIQNLMTISATFASNVVNFCEQLEEFWAFSHLLKGMTQRLSHCCNKELGPLMELPSVKQNRAKQLYNAGYKNLQAIAKATANDLVDNIEFMSYRNANQLIATSKMLLLEKVENLREEAEDVLDGVENPERWFATTLKNECTK